jgi:hypothetical protein
MFFINVILLIATGLVFIKLITTNHWTTGKKFLVAIVFCLMWKLSFEIAFGVEMFTPKLQEALLTANLPLAISMVTIALMVHWFDQ